jgi:predicted nucleic acid-binding Zn ribbon protein
VTDDSSDRADSDRGDTEGVNGGTTPLRRVAPRRFQPGSGDSPDNFTRLDSVLDDLVRSLAGPKSSRSAVARVFGEWESVVGEVVGGQTKPLRLDDGRLLVGVEQAAWAAQLRYMTADLLARCAEHLGPGVVTSIELRITGPKDR